MASDNNVEHPEREAPSAVNVNLPNQPEALEFTANPSEGDDVRPEKTIEVPATPAFPWEWLDEEALKKAFAHAYTPEEKDKAVKEIASVIRTSNHAIEMFKRCNEEIDNLLVYAGLFSSVLTAFNVQSYILLQPATPDPTLLMLQQISQQLNSFSLTPPGALVNSTHPVTFNPVQVSPVEAWAVWLNSLWFSSLIFSLTSAFVGIMVKQWIHEFQPGKNRDSLDIARLRQYRLNHLEKWHIAEIVAFLPVLLQIALFLFFSGLLILLWHYHSTVAIVASVLIGIVALFVVGTTIMPIIRIDCCYLSPPVYLLFNFAQTVKVGLGRLGISILWTICYELLLGHPAKGMKFLSEIISDFSFKRSTWRGREQQAVQLASATLDVDMTVQAYSTTMDTGHLYNAGAILASHDVNAMKNHYAQIQMINEQHFGQKDIEVPSPEIWTSQLFNSIRVDHNVDALSAQRYLYRDKLSSPMYHRLLLALAATVSRTNIDSLVHWRSLGLLDELFTFNPDALKLMPWNAVHRVAGAMETQLRLPRPLPPFLDDQETVQWSHLFVVLRILVQCCFAPVSSWQRLPEDMRTCMQYILELDFLQKRLLRENIFKLGLPFTFQMMQTFTFMLTYLGGSADAWGCPSAVDDFMEAIRTVIETKAISEQDNDWIQSGLQQLKASFWKCESLISEHAKQRSRDSEQTDSGAD